LEAYMAEWRDLIATFLGALGMDNTGAAQVSLYGKGSAAGDTALKADNSAALEVSLYGKGTAVGDTALKSANAADALTPTAGLEATAYQLVFNGSSWDRERGNVNVTLLANAARTAAATADVVLYNHRGIVIFIDVTARAGTTTLTPKVSVKDPVSGVYIDVWTAAAPIDTADATFAYLFYPQIAPAATTYTEELDTTLARDVRLTVTPSDTDAVTYSVGACVLV
jgi:hypothetical protein